MLVCWDDSGYSWFGGVVSCFVARLLMDAKEPWTVEGTKAGREPVAGVMAPTLIGEFPKARQVVSFDVLYRGGLEFIWHNTRAPPGQLTRLNSPTVNTCRLRTTTATQLSFVCCE